MKCALPGCNNEGTEECGSCGRMICNEHGAESSDGIICSDCLMIEEIECEGEECD